MEKPEQIKEVPTFKLGDRVKIKHSNINAGRIIELRGALGPGGVDIYRVLISKRPVVSFVEVRADQLLVAPPRPAKKSPTKPKPEAI